MQTGSQNNEFQFLLKALGYLRTHWWVFLLEICVVFAIWLTHRFVGPQVAIQRHIGHLTTGDYTHTCTLRDGDELKPIARALNELTEALRQEDRRQGIAA